VDLPDGDPLTKPDETLRRHGERAAKRSAATQIEGPGDRQPTDRQIRVGRDFASRDSVLNLGWVDLRLGGASSEVNGFFQLVYGEVDGIDLSGVQFFAAGFRAEWCRHAGSPRRAGCSRG